MTCASSKYLPQRSLLVPWFWKIPITSPLNPVTPLPNITPGISHIYKETYWRPHRISLTTSFPCPPPHHSRKPVEDCKSLWGDCRNLGGPIRTCESLWGDCRNLWGAFFMIFTSPQHHMTLSKCSKPERISLLIFSESWAAKWEKTFLQIILRRTRLLLL